MKRITPFFCWKSPPPVGGYGDRSPEWQNIEVTLGLLEDARQNSCAVIHGALSAEMRMKELISAYFFSVEGWRSSEFGEVILNSDWCSFSAKLKLVAHIITRLELLDKRQQQHVRTLLGKLMKARNAFTHGTFELIGTSVMLHYFEAVPKKQELTDEYLTSVEQTIQDALSALARLRSAMDTKLAGM